MVALLAAPALAAAQGRPHLHLTTEHTPPSSMVVDGVVTGFATEKLRVLMERAGVDIKIESMPWKRAYALALSQGDTCVYSTTRTPQRETLFKWIGPTHENDWTLFGRADRVYKLKTLEDARDMRIGAYSGDVRADYLIAEGFKVDAVQNNVSNPRKLGLERIDLWATSLRVGTAMAAEEGMAGKVVPVLTFRRTELYLACNPAVPDALVAKLNATLQAMNKEGVSGAIERRFDFWGLGRPTKTPPQPAATR